MGIVYHLPVSFAFPFPDLHVITVVRINIFGLVGKQNSETDVCVNVMFVAEAVLTF